MIRFKLPGFFFFIILLAAQQGNAQEGDFNASQLLNNSLHLHAELSVNSVETHETLWSTAVDKITIPGREVVVSVEGKDARLEIIFTIYPTENDKTILAARSETRFGEDYNSALTTFPLQYGEEVHYYPLGRVGDGVEVTPVEIFMKITVTPYLDTLDDASRVDLEASLDSSARFRLPGDE